MHGAEVYVAGENDRIAAGRTLTIKKSANHHWVGRIDTDLRDYVDIRLEIRFPTSSSTAEFAVGPRVRDETLVSGLGPAPS